MSRSKNSLSRCWGFALVVPFWPPYPPREVPAAILFALFGLGLVWALFFAPVWCGAVTRKHQPCRNNSWGYCWVVTCASSRWQKFKMMFVSRRWQQLNRGLWSSPAEIRYHLRCRHHSRSRGSDRALDRDGDLCGVAEQGRGSAHKSGLASHKIDGGNSSLTGACYVSKSDRPPRTSLAQLLPVLVTALVSNYRR